jgi:hypothetical protein
MTTVVGVPLEDGAIGLPIMKRISEKSEFIRDDFSNLNTGGHGPHLTRSVLDAIDRYREQLVGLRSAERYFAGKSKLSNDALVRRLGNSVKFCVFSVVTDKRELDILVSALERLSSDVH